MAEKVSVEELQSILTANNLSFSDIAKIANMVKAKKEDKTEEITVITKEKTKPQITYELTKISYPDFVVKKQSKTQTKELVIAPSCKGYFIRTLKKGDQWEIEELTGEGWASFFSDCPLDKLPTLPVEFYVDTLQRGKVFGSGLLQYFNMDGIIEMIKNKCAPKYQWEQFKEYGAYTERAANIQEQVNIYKLFPVIYKEFANHESAKVRKIIKENPGIALFVYRIYGIEKTRDFIHHFNLCLYTDAYCGYISTCNPTLRSYEEQNIYNKLYDKHTNDPKDHGELFDKIARYIPGAFPLISMEYETLRDYLLYESYKMGFGKFSDFLPMWRDTLTIEHELFGKIKEKYPEYLQVYHDKLSRRYNGNGKYREPEFIKRFTERSKELNKYNWKNDKYFFMVPKTPSDIVEEADMQSNCLVSANYADRFIEKTSILVFMRKNELPNNSYITIEIVENDITQAYLANNRTPSAKDKEVIREYAEALKLNYNK